MFVNRNSFGKHNSSLTNELQKDDSLFVSSEFWARIRPENFLKLRPESRTIYNSEGGTIQLIYQ